MLRETGGTAPSTDHTRVAPKPGEISFLGRRWEIAPGEIKQVTIVQQQKSFRGISRPPTPRGPQWPDILAEFRLYDASMIRKTCPPLLSRRQK